MHAAHALIHVYACALYLTIRASALPLVSVALVPRRDAIINVLPDGNVTVFNPDTQLPIPQGPATDGAGVDFSVPAVLWIAFSAIIGAPLALAGVRLARFTTGCALGLAGVVCSWAAVVNTIAANGVADLTLTLIVFAFFAVLFSLGLLSRFRAASLAVLAIVGGLSLGVRIALLRPGLLVPIYAVNWAIIALLGAVGGLLMIFKHRVSVVLSSAATGTFLIALGVDLVLNKQDGMSRGLRFLFDRNTSHLADVFEHDYKPRPNTQIILAASLAAVPLLALMQHKIFPQPFWKPNDQDIGELAWIRRSMLSDKEKGAVSTPTEAAVSNRHWSTVLGDTMRGYRQKLPSRFSM